MYGQTEASPRMAYIKNNQIKKKINSIGKVISGGNFYLINNKGYKIKTDSKNGELVYTGKNVCLGYSDNHNDLCKKDEKRGMLKTGDIAYRDKDGFYYIVGRKKRFIKIFGYRVNLDEIERSVKKFFSLQCVALNKDDNLIILVKKNLIKTELIVKYLNSVTKINKNYIKIIEINKLPLNQSGKINYEKANSIKI